MTKHSEKHQGIVVGVDGSPSSNTAVCWAAREAAMRNVSLSLIHVIERPPWGLLALGGGAVQPPPDALEWQRTEGAEIISAAVKIAKYSTQDRCIPDLHAEVYFSAIGPTLFEFSAQAQVVVVGSRGHTAVGRVLLGSVSTRLIHHARCPVAVVHGGAQSASERSQLPVAARYRRVAGIGGGDGDRVRRGVLARSRAHRHARVVRPTHARNSKRSVADPASRRRGSTGRAAGRLARAFPGCRCATPNCLGCSGSSSPGRGRVVAARRRWQSRPRRIRRHAVGLGEHGRRTGRPRTSDRRPTTAAR